jgi:disulfide oxidoreductase YuzD
MCGEVKNVNKEFSYEQDLAIDPHSLDEEWLRQPGLFMKYSEAATDAQRIRDIAKEKVDVVKAELAKAIRKDPAKYGVDKVTENVVAETVLLQPEYKKAVEELVEMNFKFNILQSAVRAFDHKRGALENVVKLWLGSYFSGPKVPKDIPGGKRIVDMARDRVSGQAREKINERKEEPVGESEGPKRHRS